MAARNVKEKIAIICPNCGAEIPRYVQFCLECKSPLDPEEGSGSTGSERPDKARETRGAPKPSRKASPESRTGINWPVAIGFLLVGLILGWLLFHPKMRPGGSPDEGVLPAGHPPIEAPAASEPALPADGSSESQSGQSSALPPATPGTDFAESVARMIEEAGLSGEQQQRLLVRLQAERCPCPCGHALIECNHGGEACTDSLPVIRRLIAEEKQRGI